MRGKERGHEPNFEEKVAERRERRELEDVHATIALLEKQLAEAEGAQGSPKQQLNPTAEKEQLKVLQKQLKEERKKVSCLSWGAESGKRDRGAFMTFCSPYYRSPS